MTRIDRRAFIFGASAGAIGLMLPSLASAVPAPRMVMWKDPNCGCCTAWGSRVEAAFGGRLSIVPLADMPAQKRRLGVPESLWSCHSATIGGVVVEGHVPPADIQRLVASGDRSFRGLAVPGMPAGSPGMDVGHAQRERYQVIAFGPGTRRAVFATHG